MKEIIFLTYPLPEEEKVRIEYITLNKMLVCFVDLDIFFHHLYAHRSYIGKHYNVNRKFTQLYNNRSIYTLNLFQQYSDFDTALNWKVSSFYSTCCLHIGNGLEYYSISYAKFLIQFSYITGWVTCPLAGFNTETRLKLVTV